MIQKCQRFLTSFSARPPRNKQAVAFRTILEFLKGDRSIAIPIPIEISVFVSIIHFLRKFFL